MTTTNNDISNGLAHVLANKFIPTIAEPLVFDDVVKAFLPVQEILQANIDEINQHRDSFCSLSECLHLSVNQAVLTSVYDKTNFDNIMESQATLFGTRAAKNEAQAILLETEVHEKAEDANLPADVCIRASRFAREYYADATSKALKKLLDDTKMTKRPDRKNQLNNIEDLRRSICGCTIL